jgi:hypothetical protein
MYSHTWQCQWGRGRLGNIGVGKTPEKVMIMTTSMPLNWRLEKKKKKKKKKMMMMMMMKKNVMMWVKVVIREGVVKISPRREEGA